MSQSREIAELGQALPTLLAETRARQVPLAIVFAVLALALLVAGLLWPRSYSSSTTILAQEDNIIQPLMEGRAVSTSVTDRARIAREVIFGQRIIDVVLEEGGWVMPDTGPIQRDLLKEQLKARTRVSSGGPNLISISYRDDDPIRAYKIAARYAELFIAESLAAKERESREAYEFIAARVAEYHSKLLQAEENLKQYRSENQDARPGSQSDVEARVIQLRGNIETARTGLSELQMREAALVAQLSGEAQVNAAQTREAQTNTRLIELRNQLDGLLLNYTDAHPDVVRVRHQIEDLQEELQRLATLGEATAAGEGSRAAMVSANPLFHSLRADLAQVRSDIAALRARVTENSMLLESELDRGRRVAESEAALAELTRDYEVNRDLYQDLLRRRENARVSMSLDSERRGLTFSVQEPAALPLRPSGLRFVHFAAAGLVLGLALPLALVYLLVRFDPRVRSPRTITEGLPVALLVNVPLYRADRERRRERWRTVSSVAIVVAVAAAYGAAAWVRLHQIG